jgi:hypothetical protein
MDWREPLVRAMDASQPHTEIAGRFGVSPVTVGRYRRHPEQAGTVSIKGREAAPRLIQDDAALVAQLTAPPHATLSEFCSAGQPECTALQHRSQAAGHLSPDQHTP